MSLRKFLLFLLTLTFISCAGADFSDPLEEMKVLADKKISNPITIRKYKLLLDDYMLLINSYNAESLYLYNKYIQIIESYNPGQTDEVESLLQESFLIRQELRTAVMDIEDDMRKILSPSEWRKTRHRSLIVLSEYYIQREYIR